MSRPAALHIIKTLRQAGHVALLAGGCVRDRLLGQEPQDHDVATDAPPEQVRALFKRTRAVGEAFGVVLVDLQRDGQRSTTEVATFRTEGVYSDGRRPDAVEYSDAKHDAQRRDFTVNGLFEDPDCEHPDADADGIIDYVGGRADLEAKMLRAVGDPAKRFSEDYLRMLRAPRFASRLGFTLDPQTFKAIQENAAQITRIARERIGDEIRRALCGPDAHAAAMWLELGELAAAVLDTRWAQTKGRLSALRGCDPEADYPTRLWLWMHARGTPLAPTHLRKALALSNEETEALKQLRRFHDLPDLWAGLSVAGRKRRLAEPGREQAFLAWNAGTLDKDTAYAIQQAADALAADGIGLAPDPLVTGGDLIAQGLEPGPEFRRRLDAAYDAQLEGAAMNKDQALAIALQ